MEQRRSGRGRKRSTEREVVTDAVDGQLRLLRLAAKGRVERYYYTGMFVDAVDRGVLAATVRASTDTLEAMAGEGWLVPLPSSSRFMRGQWTVTDAGQEEIERLTGGRG